MKIVSYNNVKKKLILLYLLNVSDLFFTFILLDSSMFFEGNNIMASVISNKYLSIILKCILVFALIVFIIKRLKKASEKQLVISNVLVNIIVVVYAVINISHLCGITLLLNM